MARRRTNKRRSRKRSGGEGDLVESLHRGFSNVTDTLKMEDAKAASGIKDLVSTGLSRAQQLGQTGEDDTKNMVHTITKSAQNAVGAVGHSLGNVVSGAQHAFRKVKNTVTQGGKYRKTKRKHRKYRKSKKSHKKH